MRVSEIRAVRDEVLFDGYILVSKQYSSKYGLIPTKTKDSRQVPIPSELQIELQKLTGHKSQAMTDHYTHFKADDFKNVQKIQAKILQMPLKGG